MSNLSLFPSRVRIVNSDGTMTPEFYRALDVLFQRVGGPLGNFGGEEYSMVASASEAQGASLTLEMAMQPATPADAYQALMEMQRDSTAFVSEIVLQSESSGGAIAAVTPGASPYTYTATSSGALSVQGGAVSQITYTRGSTTVTLGLTAGLIPVREFDKVTITYSVAPVVNFIPR